MPYLQHDLASRIPRDTRRLTAATVWLQSGIDIATVAAWLGHSNSAITHRTYLHYMKADSDLSGIARINARAAAKKLEMVVED